MKSNLSAISELRQQLDMLGAQFSPNVKVDPALIGTLLRNIGFAASDLKTPLPDDIFVDGISDHLARLALSGLCMATIQMLSGARVTGTK